MFLEIKRRYNRISEREGGEVMEQKNETEVVQNQRITDGVIWKQLILFSIPIMIGTLFQQLYNMIDAIVVGNFVGKTALASVGGSTQQIVGLVLGFFVELSSGAAVVIAQYYGAGEKKKLSDALHTTIAFCVVAGVILSLVGYFGAPTFLRWMNTPEDTMDGSILYLKIYFCGILFSFFYNVGAAILRAVGDSRKPLYYLMVCCILNTVLDVLLVLVFRLGIFGVAIATVFSQAVSALLILITLVRTKDIYRLSLLKISICRSSLLEMLRIGIPMGMQALMYSASNIVIQMALNRLGTDTVAAWSVFTKIDAFYWMVLTGFGIAITTFAGQNYGAKKYKRVLESVSVCVKLTLCISIGMSIFFLLCGKGLFGAFTADKNVIGIGVRILKYMAPAYALFVFIEIYSGALRGIGDVIIPTIMTCFGVCIFRIVWIFVIVPMNPTIEAVTLSHPVSWGVTALLYIIYWNLRKRRLLKG